MIAFFFGKDDFTAHEALRSLTSELDGDGMLADNTVRVEGADARPAELLTACQTMPFLAAKRVIVVRGLLKRFETGGRRGRQRKNEEALGPWAGFVEGLAGLPETTVLVFIDGELRPQNPMLQALRPLAQVQEFKALPQAELAGWINDRAKRYGVSIEARAVAALAGLVGSQLWTLDSEIQKLGVYAGERQVTEADVRSLVSLAREPNVFAMADAAIEGRARDAADLLERLFADGEPPPRLLAMLVRQYRLLLLTKEMLGKGVRAREIVNRLKLRDFAVQRLVKQAPAYTIGQLRRAYRRLLEADLSIKRGIYDDQTALELLLFELATMAGARGAATRPGGRPGYSRPPTGRAPSPSGAARTQSGTS